MTEQDTRQSASEKEILDEELEREIKPPLRSIAITVAAICTVFIAVVIGYAVRLNTSPESECAYRGGTWLPASRECIFEGGVSRGNEQVGMQGRTVVVRVPETDGAVVTFENVEIGAPYADFKEFSSGGPRLGSVSLVGELGRVQKETQDLIMPFVVTSGGSGVFMYLGIFEKQAETYTLTDSVFVGDRIGGQGLTLSAVTSGAFTARFAYRDRREGQAYSDIPTEPRTLEAIVYDHKVDTSFVLGRDGILYKDLVRVSAPDLRAEVTSPLIVEGSARGTWYFEASFPVTLVDWDGKILAEGVAQAKGDWMTEDFVPFEAKLTFAVPSDIPYRRGTLILRKDNPSGLSENDDAFEIPISF